MEPLREREMKPSSKMKRDPSSEYKVQPSPDEGIPEVCTASVFLCVPFFVGS
jgi:hypothetical protein